MENEQAVSKQQKPIVKRVFSIILYVLLGLIAVFVLFLVVSRFSGKTPFIGKYTALWVLTNSMENLEDPDEGFPAKTYILIQKVDPKDVEAGDIITFYSSDPSLAGGMNTHRVVEVIGDHEEFRTKGDNIKTNPVPDTYTAKAENIVGIYVRRLPVLTALGRLFMTGAGLMLVCFVILAITGAAFIPDILQANREKKAEEQAELDRRVQEEVEKLKQQNNNQNGNPPTN